MLIYTLYSRINRRTAVATVAATAMDCFCWFVFNFGGQTLSVCQTLTNGLRIGFMWASGRWALVVGRWSLGVAQLSGGGVWKLLTNCSVDTIRKIHRFKFREKKKKCIENVLCFLYFFLSIFQNALKSEMCEKLWLTFCWVGGKCNFNWQFRLGNA